MSVTATSFSEQENTIRMDDTKKKLSVHRMVMTAALANVPAFVYGLSFGWMSPMVPLLQSPNTPSSTPISDTTVSWMAGCLPLGAGVATPLFSVAVDRFGRKPMLMFTSLLFAISWTIKLSSAEASALIAARACTGLAAAGVYLTTPIYVREISEDSIRGALGSIMLLACNLGVITVYGLGVALSYYNNLWLYLTLPILHVVAFYFMPESPAYSVKRQRFEEAAETIAWLRNLNVCDPIVLNEVAQLQKDDENAKVAPKLTVRSVAKDRGLFRAVRIAFVLVSTETASGCFAVIQYAALIFYRAGTAWRPEYLALFVGTTQLLGSILSIYAVERCGRKPLLATSTMVIAGSMCGIAVWFCLSSHGLTVPGWVPVVAVCLCIFSYGAGLASVPFVIVAEIFSFQMRARLSAFVVSASWLLTIFSVFFFVPVANAFGDHVVFFIFTAIALAGGLYTIFCVPETRNKPLSQIQAELEGNIMQ